jgi:uncharacterized protein (TIGR03437 family)
MSAASHIRQGLIAALVVAFSPHLCGEIHVLAVTTATGFTPGLPAPGSLASAFCTGLAGTTDVHVSVNADAAPILAVADLGGYQQINFQIPWETQNASTVTVTQGLDQAVFPFPAARVWDVFFVDPSGAVVAQHASDYELVTPAHPARPGEWIIAYASNLGPVQNPPPTGMPASLDRLSPLAPGPDIYTVLLLGSTQSATLQSIYMGLVPGVIGVYQINLRMPDGFSSAGAELKVQKTRFCGFFFDPACGRGLYLTVSAGSKLPFAP